VTDGVRDGGGKKIKPGGYEDGSARRKGEYRRLRDAARMHRASR
jgi:hypothetical protein